MVAWFVNLKLWLENGQIHDFSSGWLVEAVGRDPKMLQFENWNLIENCYTRNTNNSTSWKLQCGTCLERFPLLLPKYYFFSFLWFAFPKGGVVVPTIRPCISRNLNWITG